MRRDGHDCDGLFPALHDRFERIGETGDDVESQGGLTIVGSKPTGDITDPDSRERADDTATETLKNTFVRRKVSHRIYAPVTDDDIRLTSQDRGNQPKDVFTWVLAIGIGMDDDVCAQP